MRDITGSVAESARAALFDRWTFRDNGDESDASDDEGEPRGADYYRYLRECRPTLRVRE